MNEAIKRFCFSFALLAWAREYVCARCDFERNHDHDYPCFIWNRGGDGRYGHAYLFGLRIKAHILAFIVFGGKLKRGQVVDHLCNRTLCCQPRHLRAATQSQNMARCFAVGRGRSPFIKQAGVASNDQCG